MSNTTQTDIKKTNTFRASADEICFEAIQLQEDGLHIPKEFFATFQIENGSNAMMMIRSGEILLVNDPKRVSLMRCAHELQLRQDELKQDYSDGITAIIDKL